MHIFLSYAAPDKGAAESIAFSLRNRGYRVFLDRDDLPAGQSYDEQIGHAVKKSQIFIFLISPDSVAEGRYALTELKFARRKWNDPSGRVLPVMVRETPLDTRPLILEGGDDPGTSRQSCRRNERSNRRYAAGQPQNLRCLACCGEVACSISLRYRNWNIVRSRCAVSVRVLGSQRPFEAYPDGPRPSGGFPSDGFPSDGFPSGGFPSDGFPSGGFPSGGFPSDGFDQL